MRWFAYQTLHETRINPFRYIQSQSFHTVRCNHILSPSYLSYRVFDPLPILHTPLRVAGGLGKAEHVPQGAGPLAPGLGDGRIAPWIEKKRRPFGDGSHYFFFFSIHRFWSGVFVLKRYTLCSETAISMVCMACLNWDVHCIMSSYPWNPTWETVGTQMTSLDSAGRTKFQRYLFWYVGVICLLVYTFKVWNCNGCFFVAVEHVIVQPTSMRWAFLC